MVLIIANIYIMNTNITFISSIFFHLQWERDNWIFYDIAKQFLPFKVVPWDKTEAKLHQAQYELNVLRKEIHFIVMVLPSTFKFGIFLGEMHGHMSHEEAQKNVFAAVKLFWPEGCLRDFLAWRRPLKAKKPRKTALRPKQTWLKQNKFLFLFFKMMKNVVHPVKGKKLALPIKRHSFG